MDGTEARPKDMAKHTGTTVLRGAHVIDPAQAIDRVVDVIVTNGKIAAVDGEAPAGAEVVDLSGHYLSPGWIDLHIHAYGMLGFANPDTIGIYQGVTTFVDAGGPGIGVMDEFAALLEGQLVTDLYAGQHRHLHQRCRQDRCNKAACHR